MPFKKGTSGNKKGRPPKTEYQKYCEKEFKQALQTLTPEAVETLSELLKTGDNKTKTRVATYIIDKSFGQSGGHLLNSESNQQNIIIQVNKASDKKEKPEI